MKTNVFYQLLLCFASGFTVCMLVVCCIFLIRKHCTYQFHRAFATTLILLAIGFFNNFIVAACSNTSIAEYINTLLLLFDYIIVGCLMIFTVSLVFPGRFKAQQLSLIEVPYLLAFVAFAITANPIIYTATQIFTITFSLILLIWLGSAIIKYNKMLRDNVGNIEYFDLHWGAILIVLLFVVQLIWAVESLSQRNWFSTSYTESNLIFDTFWCIITIIYVLLILHKIIHQQVFIVPPQETLEQNCTGATSFAQRYEDYYKILIDNNIDHIIQKNKFYLDNTLTLHKLATHLGTNRQYLSNYINKEKKKTFYEYINDFRIEEAKRLLFSAEQHSMEEIATISGFKSYSTFLRSFVKKYGISPSKFAKRKS